MEFGVIRGMIDTRSFLNIDDLNGFGSKTFKKISNIPSVDFALFKIAAFAICESVADRKKFTLALPSTIEELGPKSCEFILPLLTSLVLFL